MEKEKDEREWNGKDEMKERFERGKTIKHIRWKGGERVRIKV